MNTMYLRLGAVIGASTLAIIACGGGGDGGGGASGNAGTAATSGNPFVAMVGNWSSGCVNTTLGMSLRSELVTATVSNPSGADKATVSISDQTFIGSTSCDPAKLDQSGEAGGQVTALPGTKLITGDPDHLKKGTALKADFRLDSMKFHKVSLNFIPTTGTTSHVGYMLEGGKLYGVGGSRQADGLGYRFANIALTKQ